MENGKTYGNREEDVVSAQIRTDGQSAAMLDSQLESVNRELERCTSAAARSDYAYAMFCGVLAGAVDAFFVGEIHIRENDIALSHEHVNRFVEAYATKRGMDPSDLKDAIRKLENNFKVPQDNVWKGKDWHINPQNHHLADLAHHPTPIGLLSALIIQFLRVATFVNRDGQVYLVFLKPCKKDMMQLLVPAILTGILHWLVNIGEDYLNDKNIKLPKSLHNLARLIASAPAIFEIVRCADNWFAHLTSDLGGSKSTPGGGMGLPGVLLSFLYELAALPGLRGSGLLKYVNGLYVKGHFDLRHELAFMSAVKKQAVPVILNELLVRTGYFVSRLVRSLAAKELKPDWQRILPFNNRTVDRLMTVASMTFTLADTADAAVHAAIESRGNWVIFAGKFVARFNYAGAGRAMLAVVREITDENREAELLREKRLLTEAKAALSLEQLQAFGEALDVKLCNYLAEHIECFMNGFDDMSRGLAEGDSNLVIRGNVTIQTVLGREPQFRTQAEFDSLMESDDPLIL